MKKIILLSSLLLLSCSQTPTIITKPVIVKVPEIRDTVITLHDTVIVRDDGISDSLWIGNVKDSLGKEIGELKVYFKKKIAELNIKARTDTLFITDTIKVKENNILPIVTDALSWWEKTILYGGMGIIISLIIYLRVKRGKII